MAIWSVEARDLTDDDFDDEDEPSYKKKSGGGGGGYKKKKDDDDSDDDEAVAAGLKKLNALREKRKSLTGGRVSIEDELLGS